jgi:hypothetical protein
VHLAADAVIAGGMNAQGDDYSVALALGIVFAQVALAAAWTAWAPVSLAWRVGGGLLAIAFVVLMLALAIRETSGGDEIGAMLYGVILLAQWMLSQAPLWLARIGFGHRIVPWQAGDGPSSRREMQFGLGQLLALTACVAILLVLARWLYSPESAQELGKDWRMFAAIAAMLAGFQALAPLPAFWAAFAGRTVAWLVAAALFLGIATVAENFALAALTGDTTASGFLAVMQGVVFVTTVATLLAVGRSGYRLIGAPR